MYKVEQRSRNSWSVSQDGSMDNELLNDWLVEDEAEVIELVDKYNWNNVMRVYKDNQLLDDYEIYEMAEKLKMSKRKVRDFSRKKPYALIKNDEGEWIYEIILQFPVLFEGDSGTYDTLKEDLENILSEIEHDCREVWAVLDLED